MLGCLPTRYNYCGMSSRQHLSRFWSHSLLLTKLTRLSLIACRIGTRRGLIEISICFANAFPTLFHIFCRACLNGNSHISLYAGLPTHPLQLRLHVSQTKVFPNHLRAPQKLAPQPKLYCFLWRHNLDFFVSCDI